MAKVYNNRYEVIEELGTGAFSVVYKAKVLEKARKVSHDSNEVSSTASKILTIMLDWNEYRGIKKSGTPSCQTKTW